jgi:hypothetical protein
MSFRVAVIMYRSVRNRGDIWYGGLRKIDTGYVARISWEKHERIKERFDNKTETQFTHMKIREHHEAMDRNRDSSGVKSSLFLHDCYFGHSCPVLGVAVDQNTSFKTAPLEPRPVGKTTVSEAVDDRSACDG